MLINTPKEKAYTKTDTSFIRNVDHLAFRKAMLARDMYVWGGLHISPRGAPSKGAKLCTCLRWFARPDRTSTVTYYELPLPVTKLRSIFHFRVGAHSLPVEQGRIEMPKVLRHLRRYTFCATTAIGDERHCVFDCPHFQGLPSAQGWTAPANPTGMTFRSRDDRRLCRGPPGK